MASKDILEALGSTNTEVERIMRTSRPRTLLRETVSVSAYPSDGAGAEMLETVGASIVATVTTVRPGARAQCTGH